jgi:peptide/nickel transport system substrate-binding protein
MRMTTRIRLRGTAPVLFGALALTASLLPAAPGRWDAAARAASPHYLITLQNFHTVMTRNFNPFAPTTSMDFTQGGIYEPLMVITPAGGGHIYPWLATAYTYRDRNKTLLITIRHGVRWSDGLPFTARDVLYTYTLGKVDSGADQIGLIGNSVIKDVALMGNDQVAVHFKRPDTAA